jgi:hypothetical protein
MTYMFRGKTFQISLPGHSYRIFIEGLKSPVTKAAYSYGLQKYMNYLNITNPDDLLVHQENPKSCLGAGRLDYFQLAAIRIKETEP